MALVAEKVKHSKKTDPGPDFSLESRALCNRTDLFSSSHRIVIGVDEAGRGPWAGPVTAGAAWVNPDQVNHLPEGLNDSKKINANKRKVLFDALAAMPDYVQFGVSSGSVALIDRIGILKATFAAMDDAVMALIKTMNHNPEIDICLLVDGNLAPPFPKLRSFLTRPPTVTPVIKGDGRSLSIAAASIMAKQTRDDVMMALGQDYPDYGWADNKGYGTAGHQAALAKQGITPHHRQSFKPIAALRDKIAPQDKGG